MGLLARIAGPKVLLGVLIAAGLALGWMWWMYSSAAADAAAAHSRAEQASAAAEANAEAARAAELERELLDEVLTNRADRERRLERRLADTHDQLQEARANASQEVRDCLRLRLPGDYLDGLRAPDGDAGGDAPGGAAGQPDPADPPAPAAG
jgi:predicted negative regulator of RcsB-dependent stress response